MKFSDRIGATKVSLELYIDSIPDSLRNSIWNLILELYTNPANGDERRKLCLYLAKNFRKSRVDQVPSRGWEVGEWLQSYYYSLEWYEIYNVVEFLVNHHYFILHDHPGNQIDQRRLSSVVKSMENQFNHIFKVERAGYRFIGGILSPITDRVELEAVTMSLHQLNEAKLTGAKDHIQTALELFSLRPSPDYRNSIKESISAVESISKIIGSKDGDGISTALRALSEKANLHGSLRSAFEKLYGFTSDDEGIRHAMIDDPTVGFDEAKYMIVSCSAFCSYLLSKAQSAGLIK
jgi:hypothetical protein